MFLDQLSERRVLARAHSGSRHRSRVAEVMHGNDLMSFHEHQGKVQLLLDAAKRKNHRAIPPRPRPAPMPKVEEEPAAAPEPEPKPAARSWGLFGW